MTEYIVNTLVFLFVVCGGGGGGGVGEVPIFIDQGTLDTFSCA